MDSATVRVPYKNLKHAEVELVGLEEPQHKTESSPGVSSGSVSASQSIPQGSQKSSFITLIFSCMVAAGVQFGWALQLSLLTPYIQTLGIEHTFSSFIWLCGPLTGLVVQPCVGIWSDKCRSKHGRRRPFILAGSLMISLSVIIIGFSADLGYLLGDANEDCRTFKGTRTRAAIAFIFGFWMLDLANNTVQGPARALLADLSGPDQRNSANAIFCSWMAVGNILGFSSGSSGKWHRWFPFLTNRACCEACGNLKAAFLVAVVFLTFCTLVTLYFAEEIPLSTEQPSHLSDSVPLLDGSQQHIAELSSSKTDIPVAAQASQNHVHFNVEMGKSSICDSYGGDRDPIEAFSDGPGAVMVNLLTSLRHLPPDMHAVLVVMALSWLSWFPFFLFDTDWMGREIYHGNPKGDISEVQAYDKGVREGAFGLLLNSVVLGIGSFLIEPLCQRMGARLVWATSNFIVFACMACTAVISFLSVEEYVHGTEHANNWSDSVRVASLVVFAILGLPLSITYSVPFSITAELTADSGGGQGLAIGVLNLAIVLPQMVVSLGAGPWDALFGGGNIPAFVIASLAALAAGIVALLKLPTLSTSSYKSSGFHFG